MEQGNKEENEDIGSHCTTMYSLGMNPKKGLKEEVLGKLPHIVNLIKTVLGA
jgi:hypothetical protein